MFTVCVIHFYERCHNGVLSRTHLSDNNGALVRSCSFVGISVLTDVVSLSFVPSVLPSVKLLAKKNCVILLKSGVEIVSAKSGSCDLNDSISSAVNYNKIIKIYYAQMYMYISMI